MSDIIARGMAANAMSSGGGGGGGTTVDAYSKNETDNLLRGKANVSDVYTSQQTDDLLDDKVDKVSGKSLSTNDYTNEDMSLVKTISNKANTNDVNASITNLQNQISETSENVDTINTELMTNAGYSLGMSINPTTFELTMTLKNSTGGTVSSQKVDLPIESMVVSASYANGKLSLKLQNGQTLDTDISAIVAGLVNQNFTIAGIDMKDNIEANELKTALGINTITSDVSTLKNDMSTAKTNISTIQSDISGLKTRDSELQSDIDENTTAIEQNKSDILSAEKSIIINQSTIGFQSKNILPNVQPSKAHEGITYTVNADKSITCNGTTGSTASYFSLNSIFTELPDNVDVVFSGCPAGGTVDRYALQLYEEVSPNNKIHWNDYGGGVTGKLPKINNGKYKAMIVIRPNQTVENLTFYPMLRYAGTDDTYVPYIPTVLDRINALVAEIAELKANQAQTTTE